MPDKGIGPSQGLIARLLAIIMGGGEGDIHGGLTPNPNAQDIYLPPEGPSMQERMDRLMQPRSTPLMPSLGPSTIPTPPVRRAPTPDPQMEEIERLRKRNERMGKYQGGVRG